MRVMEERQLIRKAKNGDTLAFASLYEKIYKKLYQFAYYTLRNKEDAEDVVSDTVLDAFHSIKKLKSEDAFSSWIFCILSRKCKEKMRDYYRNEVELNTKYFTTENSGTKMEDAIDVKEMLQELTYEDRMIITMHIIFGYKTREIAQALNMNENTVRSRESRVLKKIGERWERECV